MDLGLQVTGRIHSTRLKNRILAQFEDPKEYRDEWSFSLAFESDMGDVLYNASTINLDDEAYILTNAARIIRRNILDDLLPEVDGDFRSKCQEHSCNRVITFNDNVWS